MADSPLDDGTGLTIVNEQLRALGGAERILEILRERIPNALLLALDFESPSGARRATWAGPVEGIDAGGGPKTHFRSPLHARRMRGVRLDGLVLAVGSQSWAHTFRRAPGTRHVALAHGLPRQLYGHRDRYLRQEAAPLRPLLRAAVPLLRGEYRRALRAPHRRLTVSRWSAAAMERVHGSPWEVIHPPVRTGLFTPRPAGRRADGPVVMTARLVPHKRIDVVIEAVRELDVKLVLIGGGPLRAELERCAPSNVTLAGPVGDRELADLIRSASLFVSAASEEFGIALAEAQASGIPAIAPAAGGAAEVLDHGSTGLLLDEVTPATLRAAIVAARARTWDAQACRHRALRFRSERFVSAIEEVLEEELALAELPRRAAPAPASQAVPA